MMIRLLQASVVIVFLAMSAIGVVVLFSAPDLMDEYKELSAAIFPVFLAQVIPALIGSPLTDYIRARAAKRS